MSTKIVDKNNNERGGMAEVLDRGAIILRLVQRTSVIDLDVGEGLRWVASLTWRVRWGDHYRCTRHLRVSALTR